MKTLTRKIQIPLLESYGEYDDIDRDLNEFFPMLNLLWKSITTKLEDSKTYKPEEKYINSVIKGNHISLKMYPAVGMINAMTIPGLKSWTGLNKLTLETYITLLKKNEKRFNKLQNAKPGPNREVHLPSIGMPILLLITQPLMQRLTPEERIALYLHEIGHWAFTKDIRDAFVFQSHPLSALFNFIEIIRLKQAAEKKADLFAKQCGYGKEMQDVLKSVLIPRTKVHALITLWDVIRWPLYMFAMNLPMEAHPAIWKRIKYLDSDSLKRMMKKFDVVATDALKSFFAVK